MSQILLCLFYESECVNNHATNQTTGRSIYCYHQLICVTDKMGFLWAPMIKQYDYYEIEMTQQMSTLIFNSTENFNTFKLPMECNENLC